MMIHLALDDLPDWRAGAELRQFAYVHLAPSLDAMARTYQQAMAGLLPDEPVLVVGQPTAIDPSRAPQGKHVLWVQVRMLPAEILGDAAGKIAPAHWDRGQGAPMPTACIDIIETLCARPAAKDPRPRGVLAASTSSARIPISSAATRSAAATIWRRISCFARRAAMPRWNTPVANLHLVGAATWPGAGVGAGSGFMLAQQLGGR